MPQGVGRLGYVGGTGDRVGVRMRMKHSQHLDTLFVGPAIRRQQHAAVDLVDLGRLGDVGTRHDVTDDAVRGTQEEPAAFVRQSANTRRDNRVSLSLGQCQHIATLPTAHRRDDGREYPWRMARAKQVQERRAQKKDEASHSDRVVATNRRARHDYEILETLECGIVLTGSEVKSLREGKAQIADSFARIDNGELWLFGMHIPPWVFAVGFGSHDPDRHRKLLIHRHQLDQLNDKTHTQPLTIVPLKLYFKDGRAKIEIALARGRKQYDHRQALAKRDAEREIARTMRNIEKFG